MSPPVDATLSAPLWLLGTLHIVTLTLHFAAMNVVVGGAMIAAWGRFNDRWQHPTVKALIRLLPSAMAATVTLGVAPLLFSQAVYPRQLYSAAIVSGWFWMSIVVLVICAYYCLYAASFMASGRRRPLLLVALGGLIAVSFIYSSVFSLAERPDAVEQAYRAVQSGIFINRSLGDYALRWLHMVLGAVAVGGFFVGALGRNEADAFAVGKKFFVWGTVANFVVGFAYVGTLGTDLRPLMRSPGIWAISLGVLLSLGCLHFFAVKKFVGAAAMLLVSLGCMVFARHHLRLIRLREHFDPSKLEVSSQFGVLALFLLCLVAAVAVIAYMVWLYFRSGKDLSASRRGGI